MTSKINLDALKAAYYKVYDPSLTQEQIARSLGVHRPSLTHIAQNLRERKIIDYVRGKIFILNQADLEKAACSCFLEMDRHHEHVCRGEI